MIVILWDCQMTGFHRAQKQGSKKFLFADQVGSSLQAAYRR
jgi:hypothetical protein